MKSLAKDSARLVDMDPFRTTREDILRIRALELAAAENIHDKEAVLVRARAFYDFLRDA